MCITYNSRSWWNCCIIYLPMNFIWFLCKYLDGIKEKWHFKSNFVLYIRKISKNIKKKLWQAFTVRNPCVHLTNACWSHKMASFRRRNFGKKIHQSMIEFGYSAIIWILTNSPVFAIFESTYLFRHSERAWAKKCITTDG